MCIGGMEFLVLKVITMLLICISCLVYLNKELVKWIYKIVREIQKELIESNENKES